jgi:hypothetical protein
VSSFSRIRAIIMARYSDLALTLSYRCRQELGKVIGLEPQGQCVGSDPSQLDLGTFIENGDKGCVLWNMWAVQTTG